MTEVAAGTPTPGVAPLAVLGGHPDDEPADRVHAPWAARSATAAAVVCPRDQLSMPAEEGIGRDQGVPVTAYPSPEALGLCGPAPALGVGEPETARTELLSADAMLFLERVNDVTRLLIDPTRDGHDEELQHVGKRRQTGRAEQRLSAVTNVATRRASSVESARRTASIGFLDSTPVPSLASLRPGWPCSGGTSSPPCFACCSPMRRTTSVSQHVIVLGCYDSAVACPRSRARAERPFVAVSAPSAIDEHGDSPASSRRRRCRTRRRPWPRRWDARSGRRVTPPGKRLEPACS